MKRVAKWIGVVVLLVLLAAAALPFLVDANRFRPMLEAELSKSLGREVKVGNLKLALLSGGVTAEDLSIADDPKYSSAPFVNTKAVTLGVELMPLVFSRELHVTELTLDQPIVDLKIGRAHV